jgi:hypothetical protein
MNRIRHKHSTQTLFVPVIVCQDTILPVTCKPGKSQSGTPLFDVELYLTVHKFVVSSSHETSLNIIHRGRTSLLFLLDDYLIIRKYNELNHRYHA